MLPLRCLNMHFSKEQPSLGALCAFVHRLEYVQLGPWQPGVSALCHMALRSTVDTKASAEEQCATNVFWECGHYLSSDSYSWVECAMPAW